MQSRKHLALPPESAAIEWIPEQTMQVGWRQPQAMLTQPGQNTRGPVLPRRYGLERPAKQNRLLRIEFHASPTAVIGGTAAVAKWLQVRPSSLLHPFDQSFPDFVCEVGGV